MSLKTIKKEKGNKLFRKGDLIIYLVVAVVIVVLFFVFVINKDKNDSQGLEIVLQEVVIFDYDFESDTYKVAAGYEDIVVVEKKADFFVTIFTDNGHFNKISIKTDKRQVFMVDANCSSSKDCTKMSITDDKSVIVCVPSQLLIRSKTVVIKQPTSG